MRAIREFLTAALSCVLNHKKLFFLYIPLAVLLFLCAYSGVIYLSWLSDRDAAMHKLSEYKQLIDRTEELRAGVAVASSEADVGAKVVDIPTRIYDRNGEVIGEFFEQKREIVPIS
ncbi:MAG: hypothetical protein ACRCUT_05480, partial [Spirochaetota bacterium]